MRFVFYGMAWTCILIACVYAGFAFPGSPAQWLAGVLLACGLLIGTVGYIFTRQTTRKCAYCGERVELAAHSCECCGRPAN